MKKKMIGAGVIVLLAFLGLNESNGQWASNGNHIYNTNTGYVGIGTNTPGTMLYVSKNMIEPAITVRNAGGTGGATYSMVDVASGADWKFKATQIGGFKIRDHAYTMDVLTIEQNSAPNSIYIMSGGNIGMGTTDPSAKLHIVNNTRGLIIDGAGVISSTSFEGLGFQYDWPSGQGAIQASYPGGFGYLTFHTTNAGTVAERMRITTSGKVGIGTTTPDAKVHVYYNQNASSYLGYSTYTSNYFTHNEIGESGPGQATVYGYRSLASGVNDGSGYAPTTSNSALKGYSFWGDLYSFGTSGFNYHDFTRCGGVLGGSGNGDYIYTWGSLCYKSSGSTTYGGYFTSSATGAGKSSNIAMTGIGMGSWGDLMGADIHGKVYGTYIEGENYALFADGDVYKNKLDIHLQENGSETRTVLYTNVTTDATVQTYGSATLASGKATIVFDPAFIASVSPDNPVIVTVSPLGRSNGVYLSDVSKSGFTVVENNDGKSTVDINFIAIGKRAGFENPSLAPEVISADYTGKLASGLHDDADTQTNGQGLYYENGKLQVGVHPSTLPDPNKPADVGNFPVPGSTLEFQQEENYPAEIHLNVK